MTTASRTGTATAAAALHAASLGVLGLDLQRLASRPAPEELVRVAGREALLRGCGIVAEPVEALTEGAADALRRLASLSEDASHRPGRPARSPGRDLPSPSRCCSPATSAGIRRGAARSR